MITACSSSTRRWASWGDTCSMRRRLSGGRGQPVDGGTEGRVLLVGPAGHAEGARRAESREVADRDAKTQEPPLHVGPTAAGRLGEYEIRARGERFVAGQREVLEDLCSRLLDVFDAAPDLGLVVE